MCPTDQEPLVQSIAERKNITGVWHGAFGYGKQAVGMKPVPFTLKLKQDWTGHFTGSVAEHGPDATPGAGTIDGYFGFPTIEFTKQMPVSYITGRDGVRRTLREHLVAMGRACAHERPGAPIRYRGNFLDADRVQGTWTINPRTIQVPDGPPILTGRRVGYWVAQFVPDGTEVEAAAGPAESLFDKSLLPQDDLDEVESIAYRSAGKFDVPDAERIIERFEQEKIRFDVDRDDGPIQTMPPILRAFGGYSGMAKIVELYVHPDDLPRAQAIITSDAKT